MKRPESSKGCFMKARLLFLSLFLITMTVLFLPQVGYGQNTAVPKLSLNQIEELVTHGVPDATMRTEVQRRGLAFVPTVANLDALRAKGAGPQTLEAIEAISSKITPSAHTSKPISAKGYAVVVHPTFATFKFPVTLRPIWQWGAGGLQYTWHAKLQTPQGKYEVGFFLFGPMGEMPPESGDIRKLLGNGQFSAFDGSGSVDLNVRVTGTYEGGFLTITVSGAPSVKRLFGQSPSSCDLFAEDLNQRASSHVPIQYVSN
jgi:hypothetical protein